MGDVLSIDGREVSLSHLDRVVFPDDGITKGDVVDYYRRMAPVLLPHVQDRPLTVVRHNRGLADGGFWQKGAPKGTPPWVRTVEVPKRGGVVRHIVCDDAATLVWLANQNSLTLHVAPLRASSPDNPDLVIFDLDPLAGDADRAAAAAGVVRGLLTAAGLVPFLKTSGSKGFHVVAPITPDATVQDVSSFADAVAERVVAAGPDRFTVTFGRQEREGRVYIDVARNHPAQTLVAPYSLRALPTAPVSAPMTWDELEADPDPRQHTLRSMPQRLDSVGDLWADIGSAAASLQAAASRLPDLA